MTIFKSVELNPKAGVGQLAGLKALLEHGVKLNLVGDRYPKGVDEHQLTKG